MTETLNARRAPAMPAWDDKQIARFNYRVGLFKRRGLPEPQAEDLADRLAERDWERDDRRVCIECNGLQRGNTCANNRSNAPLPTILQRCPNFSFQVPA